MKLNQIALAVASLGAVASAQAFTIDGTTVRLWVGGASAPTASVYAGFLSLCQGMSYKNAAGVTITNPLPVGGTIDAAVYLRHSSLAAPGGTGNEEMAYACTIDTSDNRAGSLEGKKVVVYHSVGGGSFNSFLPHLIIAGDTNATLLANNTYARLANLEGNACNSGTGTTTNVTVSGITNNIARYNSCGVTTYTFSVGQDYRENTDNNGDETFMDQYDNPIVPDVGYSDTEYEINQSNINIETDLSAIGSQTGTKVGQAFGVATSYKLYRKMQEKEFGATSSCYTSGTDTAPVSAGVCQPNISTAVYGTIADAAKASGMSGKIFSGSDADTLLLARRVVTSGTQSTSNLFMLNKPCATGELGGAFEPVTAGTYNSGKFTVTEGSSTGNVRGALSTATGFAIGYLSMENVPASSKSDGKYLFVKVDGVSPTHLPDGTDDSKQRTNAITGKYRQWVELVSFVNNVDPAGISEDGDLITAINKSLDNPFVTDLTGLFVSRSTGTQVNESPLYRDAKSCQPVQARF